MLVAVDFVMLVMRDVRNLPALRHIALEDLVATIELRRVTT